MGYESRVYIVRENKGGYKWECGKSSAEIVATFNLCCVEQEVLDAFKDTAECCLIEQDKEVVKDCYGDDLKSTDLLTLYNAIEYGKYWRTTALKEFLHGIISNKDIMGWDFDEFKAYHFGY